MHRVTGVFGALLACAALAGALCSTALAEEEFSWSIDADCTACHAAWVADASEGQEDKEDGESQQVGSDAKPQEEASTSSDAGNADLAEQAPAALLIQKHAALECTFCHTDEAGLTKGHRKVKGIEESDADRLYKSKIDPQTCFACHGTLEQIAEKTADVTLLTDDRGTTVNPHEVPDVEEHSDVSCSSCHYMHKGKSTEELATRLCGSCHHFGVYECYTCH